MLPPLGPPTPPYFATALARIRDALPDFPLEPAILQALLLCLVAGGADDDACQHLILRTSPEDVGLVLNLTSMILTTVFGFTTNKYRAKPDLPVPRRAHEGPGTDEHPFDFLRRLFLREKHRHTSSTDTRHHRGRKSTSAGHHARRSSTLPATSPTDSTFAPSSVPSSVPSFTPSSTPSPLPTPLHSREGTADTQADATSVTSSRRVPRSSASTLRMRPHAPRMQTEPAGVRRSGDASSAPSAPGSLPRAVVVSGLEHVEVPAQRLLLRTLQCRRLPLDTPPSASLPDAGPDGALELPPDFIMVYVCPLDPHDRPAILETLLDRFALSADIAVAPAVRQAYTAYRSSVHTPLSASLTSMSPHAPLAALHPHDTPPVSPSPRLRPLPLGASPPPAPLIDGSELARPRACAAPVPPVRPPDGSGGGGGDAAPEAYTSTHPALALYLADLFAAARHHPQLDGGLLTLRAHRAAAALVRAHRVLAGDSLGAELVAAVAAAPPAARSASASDAEGSGSASDADEVRTEDAHAWDAAPDAWLGAELRAGRRKAASVRSVEVHVHGPDGEYDDGGGGVRGVRGVQHAAFASRDSFAPAGSVLSPVPPAPEVWDVSEVDVGRVFPRVVSHRLRVRAGPEDEILGSIMHPAVRDAPPAPGEGAAAQERKTVKQIIVGILADV